MAIDAVGGEPPRPAVARPVLSVAPMMAWTDHHFRQLARMLSARTLLYTEMYPVDVVLAAAARGNAALCALLAFDPAQRPLAVQLGGRDAATMGAAAALCAQLGYDEVNINVGCPSGKVHDGGFGACLMAEPELVQRLAAAVRAAVPAHVAVTVKHRLGVDDRDSWGELCRFVEAVAAPPACVRHFTVHCRCAMLGKGLTTAWNRSVPPLRHDWAWALAARFPELSFELNGGVVSLEHARELLQPRPLPPIPGPSATPSSDPVAPACGAEGEQLERRELRVHGVMVGRAAFYSPWSTLADADRRIFGAPASSLTRRELLARYVEYADAQWASGRKQLEASVVEEMARKGVKVKQRSKGRLPLPHAAGELLKAKLHDLRQALYQPLLHLFDDAGIDHHADGREAESNRQGGDGGEGGSPGLAAVDLRGDEERTEPAHGDGGGEGGENGAESDTRDGRTSTVAVGAGGSLHPPDSKSPWEKQLRKARDSQCSVRDGVAKAIAAVSPRQADSVPG
jgi:tRNA-dihydrouridine synthase A